MKQQRRMSIHLENFESVQMLNISFKVERVYIIIYPRLFHFLYVRMHCRSILAENRFSGTQEKIEFVKNEHRLLRVTRNFIKNDID